MDLDIIIPIYNDKKNLWASLFSIGTYINTHVIIVDDCSTDCDNYDDVVEFFKPFFDVKVYRLEKNSGVGVARNVGIEHAEHEAILFLDCGDVIYTPFTLKRMLNRMIEQPEIAIMSPMQQEERDDGYASFSSSNNRCHGKIYRRSFLNKYQIRFNEDCPSTNEDIGFNILCRLICGRDGSNETIFETDDIGMVQTQTNKNSITRFNNYEYSFKQANLGLAKNAIYAFEHAKKFGVSDRQIDEKGYDALCFMYVSHISTLNMRPEFTAESLFGAVYFYHYYFGKLKKIDNDLLLKAYNETISAAYAERHFCTSKIFTLNFIDFLEQLRLFDEKTAWDENE